MQNPENKTSTTDQVVLVMDRQDANPKQSLETQRNNSVAGEEKPQNPATTRTLRRLNFSKPKSRLVEINYPPPSKSIPESDVLEPSSNPNETSTDDDDDDEWWKEGKEQEEAVREKYRKRKRKMGCRLIIEWVLFFIILACLTCSLTIETLKHEVKWGLKIWKWCLMVMVIFCGRLVSGWFMGLLVFFIERNFMLREKVLYFVYGLRKSVQNCVWLGLVLVAWAVIFRPEVNKDKKMLNKVFRGLVAVLVGATIWLVKIILVKLLASSFHVATFFDRMKESVFHHYILEALSGLPMDEELAREEMRRRSLKPSKSLPARLRDGKITMTSKSKRFGGSRRIDMEKLRKLSMESTTSALSVNRLVNYVRSSGLSTISRTVDDVANAESEISSEWEARNCAQRVFKNVAKPGAKYIEEEDLLRFLTDEEVRTVFPLFEGAVETGQIRKSSFRNWVVQAYTDRKSLAHSLNDTKTAVHQLHKLASAIVCVIIVVVSLLVMGLATTKVILVVTSQLLLVGFMFQNTCKTIFESIIFVFVMHPFDVGDRCVIDGVMMVVEEMNILTTVFLRYDNEKIYYPNSVLLTKPISNFRRSPDMGDTVDFTIDVSTSVENVTALKKAIQQYIESKPKHWSPKHWVIVKEIENVNKMKMSLILQHTMNHQNFVERNNRRSDLVFELKKIFESLGIKYHLLPQEVHLTQVNMSNGSVLMQS